MTVCRICLRPGIVKNMNIDQRLIDTHEELCDYDDIFDSSALSFCSICEYQLRKCYNFRQKCRRAHEILKTCKINKTIFDNAHKLAPPSTIGFAKSLNHQRVFNFIQNENSGDLKLASIVPKPMNVEIDIEAEAKSFHLVLESKGDLEINDLETVNDDDIYNGLEIENDEEITYEKEICNDLDIINDDEVMNKELDISNVDEVMNNDLEILNVDEEMNNDIEYVNNDENSLKIEEDNFKVEFLESDNEDTEIETVTKVQKPIYYATKTGIVSLETYISKRASEYKERIVTALEEGVVDLGDIKITPEGFLEMFDMYDKSNLTVWGSLDQGCGEIAKIKKFLLHLHKYYNPKYLTVFDIEYLNTQEKKLADFKARKGSDQYINVDFKCNKCYRGFETEYMLDYHNKWHEKSRPIKCDICPMRFPTRKSMSAHRRQQHTFVFRCKLCSIVTHHNDVMVNHFQQHQGVQYKCNLCALEYNSRSALLMHRQKHGEHVCPHCEKRYASSRGLENHIEEKHIAATILCDKCDKMFVSEAALKTHARLKHQATNNRRMYSCREPDCTMQFSTVESRASHVRYAHMGLPKIFARTAVGKSGTVPQCTKCNLEFATGAGLHSHFRSKHAKHKRYTYKCRIPGCSERFSSGLERLAHAHATGHYERRVGWSKHCLKGGEFRTCPICEEKVLNKAPTSLYNHHMLVHPNLPYPKNSKSGQLCEYCGKTFTSDGTYNDHMNKHTGARPYACNKCPKRFASLHNLNMHCERHGPWRHKCKVCGKVFGTGANLYAHTRTHIGDRRFKCVICSKGFLHSSSLKEHIDGVHNKIRRIKKKQKDA